MEARENVPESEIEGLLRQTLWGGRLSWALEDLRARHPNARLEIAAVEHALVDAAVGIERFFKDLERRSLDQPSSPDSGS